MKVEKKRELEQKRHWRVRKKIFGTPERPRMSVCFTNKHIYVQFIDDVHGVTLASVSTLSKSIPDRDKLKLGANVETAKLIGRLAAEAALACGVTQVVFDRGHHKYHWNEKNGQIYLGKVAALAEAARQAGLKF
jgi:large subunit ribosomal protein L18